MAKKIYPAWVRGKTGKRDSDGRTVVDHAGNCRSPFEVRQHANDGALAVAYLVRCRKCPECLNAKMRYWAAAGAHQTQLTFDAGRRTWFGTLTFSAEQQIRLVAQAREKWADAHSASSLIPTWWDDPECDYRFSLVRPEVVRELQLYWKRLRKAGHKFRYFVAIERHKSGLPHVHWLLHEDDAPIRKRDLQNAWPLGFTKVVLVGGNAKRTAPAAKAAFYVAKYLAKDAQARQIASLGYLPKRD